MECKEELSMQEDLETGKILSNLYLKKINILDKLRLKEIKLEKLGVSKIVISLQLKNQLVYAIYLTAF